MSPQQENTCCYCSHLSGFRIDEIKERPDSGKNKLLAPETQRHTNINNFSNI